MSVTDAWFRGARLGLFVHWDHASQQGLEVSWPLVGGVAVLPKAVDVTPEQYHSSAATFDPQAWDPDALLDLAARAGMRYAVLTTRHHAGYSLWDSAVSDYKVTDSPYGRDIVRGFVDATRDHGLHTGLYYSLPDWHHPDYPAFTQEMKPYFPGFSPPRSEPEQWERFIAYLQAQLRELLTGYGPIDLLWFDGAWERGADEWRAAEMEQLVRSLAPDIVVNDRWPARGDYATPEQCLPPTAPSGPWELCLTMNDSWGWVPEDTEYKSMHRIVHTLCECAARGGNLLLNVSPRGDGSIPEPQVERLEALARWMDAHGHAIHDSEPGLTVEQWAGPSTRTGDQVHLLLTSRPYESVTLRAFPVKRLREVTVAATGERLPYEIRTTVIDSYFPDPLGEVEIRVPESVLDPYATVLTLDVAPA